MIGIITLILRGVAQLGSAAGLGPVGRRFKSYRPDHDDYEKSKNIYTYKNCHAIWQGKNKKLDFEI